MFELQSSIIILFAVKSIVPIIIITVISGITYKYVIDKYDNKVDFNIKNYWFPFIIALIMFIISSLMGLTFNKLINEVLESANTFDIGNIGIREILSEGLFVPPQMYTLWSLFIAFFQMYVDTTRYNQNREIIKKHKRLQEKLDDWKCIPLDFVKNIFIIGKNGSGKTVAISHFAKTHIEKGEFTVILDGKGDVGKYSLYDIVKKLCDKYNRKLYIINQTLPNETDTYNPFIGCNPTQVKDMLLNMSTWSEEHYEAKNGEYYQALAKFLISIDIPISFNSIAKYGVPSVFSSTLHMYKKFIDNDDFEYYKDVIARCCEDIQGSVSRFITIARGEGEKIFNETNAFNLQRAYDEDAVVLIVLNKLKYTKFATSLGMLVLNDIKNVLGRASEKKDEIHKGFLIVYDELSVYFHEMLIDVINKARSLGGTNILSTQSISDIDLINEQLRRTIINNTHGFYLLKQADDVSAETLATAIGTKKSVEITSKLDSYGKTGDGTSKIVDEFKINPNDLKEIPNEVGYWVDTTEKKITILRTKFPYMETILENENN